MSGLAILERTSADLHEESDWIEMTRPVASGTPRLRLLREFVDLEDDLFEYSVYPNELVPYVESPDC